MKNLKAILFILLLLLSGCGQDKKSEIRPVVIAISSDIQSATPIYTYGISESIIFEETNPGLVGHKWDQETGTLTNYPMLAKSWKWDDDLTGVEFELRDDIYWSDSVKLSPEDIVFTYAAYSAPEVESVFLGLFEKFYRNKNGSVDTSRSFEILSPSKIKFKFPPGVYPSLLETDLPLIPSHIFRGVPFDKINSSDRIFINCGTGPYKMKKWERNQYIILEKRPDNFLVSDTSPDEIILKIIPDYFSRKNQLLKGEVDIVDEISTEDIDEISAEADINVGSMKGRKYDFISWNNIDPSDFSNGEISDHKLFGSPAVRMALTYAINRQSIVDEFLEGHGEIANGPISKIFREFYVEPENPFDFSPDEAKKLLESEGWTDSDNDGILDKNGENFSFVLNYASGKPLREFTANVVKANLQQIGIEVKIEPLERGIFLDKMYSRKMDAFISGWQIPIPLQMKPFWYSDLKNTPTNTAGFRDAETDLLIDQALKTENTDELKNLYSQIQRNIEKKHPVTFLFWLESYTAYNKRIKNVDINPLGSVQRCWEWKIE